ncbi:Uncharacterized protein BM_BM13594 [Brugia malayi]|uniref:Uncharacterized protein n=1 Tax=Brugia malayi TaxID=6279 RepID=A0A4E9FHJ2_BRUMA|nr:Uncharacterized protein BM_BM13594 [Brugia malayi]VIO94988.1 Uncharacterized protein BM_BM13594 [Brugia malayi]
MDNLSLIEKERFVDFVMWKDRMKLIGLDLVNVLVQCYGFISNVLIFGWEKRLEEAKYNVKYANSDIRNYCF